MKKILALLLTLAILLMAAGCGAATPDAQGGTQEGDIISDAIDTSEKSEVSTFGLSYAPAYGLNPYECTDLANRTIISLLYESLFTVTSNFSVEPVLCDTYTVSEDQTTYTFTLLDGVYFADGSELTALDVVLMGFNPHMGLLEHPTKSMQTAARQVLEQVGLAEKAQMNYLHLSEGQKQLCILARTLVSGSKLLLLDEPESALDFRFRHQMLSLLHSWVASRERSAIVTLHDPSLALNFCDKLLLLSDGGVLGVIEPKTDPLDKMEQMLSMVYGNISLQRCQNRKGESQIVILREGEA